MKLSVATYLSTILPQLNGKFKRETWLSHGQPCVTDTTYKSVEELRDTLCRRFGGHSTITDIPGGVKIVPNPGTGSGEAYQEVTLIG